jgi:nucleoside-triphosphatase THEP1
MLGYLVAEGRGAADTMLREVAEHLLEQGVRLVGAIQVNLESDPRRKCDMDLHVLTDGAVIRISQDLGALSEGCRLDPDGLERAVGLVAAALENGPELMIVNKFGKQEADGRGFRPVIGEALAAGIPVLTAVTPGQVDSFTDYAQDLAERLPEDAEVVLDWCRAEVAQRREDAIQPSNG